jgi:hypothetical protein
MNKMRLIVISAFKSDLYPVHVFPLMDGPQYLLKTEYPTKDLWSQSYLTAEQFDESPGTQSNSFSHRIHSADVRRPFKLPHGVCDRGMQFQGTREPLQQTVFQCPKHGINTACRKQPLTDFTRLPGPYIIEVEGLALGVGSRHAKKREYSAGAELYSDNPFLLVSIDRETIRSRA